MVGTGSVGTTTATRCYMETSIVNASERQVWSPIDMRRTRGTSTGTERRSRRREPRNPRRSGASAWRGMVLAVNLMHGRRPRAASRCSISHGRHAARGPWPLPGIGSAVARPRNNDRSEAFLSFASYNEPDHASTASILPTTRRTLELWHDGAQDVPVDPDIARGEAASGTTSKDGTRDLDVPRAQEGASSLDGNNPTILYGYGGFDISDDAQLQRHDVPVVRGGRGVRDRESPRWR